MRKAVTHVYGNTQNMPITHRATRQAPRSALPLVLLRAYELGKRPAYCAARLARSMDYGTHDHSLSTGRCLLQTRTPHKTDHAHASDWQLTAQDIFNHIFAFIFVVETCLMLYGLGIRCYFSTNRQSFDFVVTVAAVIDVAMDLSGTCSG